jgi:hypothetical protein
MPSADGRAFAVDSLGSNVAARGELGKFRDFWQAKAGADACKVDWDATWRNWIRRAAEGRAAARAGPAPAAKPSYLQAMIDITNELTDEQPQPPDEFDGDTLDLAPS